MKPFFPSLHENAQLKEQLGSRITDGTLAHAYLLQGPAGTGKHLLAHLIAAALSCEAREHDGTPLPCGICPACRKIMENKTPDLIFVNRGENATLGIEVIRRMKEDIYLSPTELEKKVYIIEEAEKMTAQAQNALLIVLEEPPPDVVILLLTCDASALLPTVQSRVQTLRMSLFSEEAMHRFLETSPEATRTRRNDLPRYAAVLSAAGGAPGAALLYFGGDGQKELLETREEIQRLLAALHNRTDYETVFAATLSLPQKRGELSSRLSLFLLALRDLILLKRDDGVPLVFYNDREKAREKSEQLSLRALTRLYDVTEACILQLSQNGNVAVLLTAWRYDLFAAVSHGG